MGAVEVDLRELAERLTPIGVGELRPLQGGASSLTYAGVRAGDRRRVVVKVAPPGLAPVRNRDVLRQASMLRTLGPTAVPVPEVLWEDGGDPPEVPPLFVMEFVDGVSLEPLFDLDGTDDETVVAERMRNAARVMGDLHALELLADEGAESSEEVDRWCRALATVEPTLAPGWERVADALRASAPGIPADVHHRIVHGDFRLGNLLAVDTRITAVIDWEIWALADPRIDVGWFLVNADPDTYRRPTRYVDALPARDELIALYCDAFGSTVPDLEWFEALARFKSTATWALIVKHNRRRSAPDPELEAMATTLPHLLARAEERLA